MNTFVPSFALLAGLIVTVQAQTDQVAATRAASAVPRLSQMTLDPVPSQEEAASNLNVSATRLGGMMLAQIPQQMANPKGGIISQHQGVNATPGQPLGVPTLNAGAPNPAAFPGGGAGVAGSPAGAINAATPGGQNPLGASGLPPGAPVPPGARPGQPPRPFTPPPQQPAVAASSPEIPAGDDEMVPVSFSQVPMPQILLFYEGLTGKKVIRDINVEAVTFSVDTTGELPKRKAIEFIEKSLLLNGYGFLPAGEGMVKFINLNAIKPGAEHPFILKQDELPINSEAIVTFVQPLLYLDAEELKKTLSELVQLHTYGVVTALPNTRGVAITENSNTIRYIIELLKTLDVAPTRTEKRTFKLARASAEDVAKSLADILDLEGKGSSGGSSGGKKSGGSTPAPAAPAPGAQPGGAAAAGRAAGVYGSAPQAVATPPKIVPIGRTNTLMVIARPTDLELIASYIAELDGEVQYRNFITRPLKYLSANDILPLVKDAISRGLEDSNGSGNGSSGGGSIVGNNSSNTNNQNRNNSSFGSTQNGTNSFGQNGAGGIGGGAGGLGGGGSLQPLRQNATPQSLLVGKTLLIADPVLNQIYIAGPPEHLRVLQELLDELDKRPRMVMLSVVIGQLKLDNNRDFGIDYIFKPNTVSGGNTRTNLAGTAQSRIGTAQSIIDPNAVTSLSSLTTGLPSGIQLFGSIQNQVNFAMSALASNTNFKVLSRPTLFTLNNEPASIETGLKIPVPVSSLSSLETTGSTTGQINNGLVSNIQYQDVALRLDVSPLINSDDELTLEIKQVNADVAGSTSLNGNNIPNISNQALNTKILVKNNATVLLGGLIQETTEKDRSGIPVLKDLPLIKYIASSTKDTKSRNELLVFIQPRIVTSTSDQPVSPRDGPGSTPFGGEAAKFLSDERQDPAAEKKAVHRSGVSSFFHKLFE